MGFPTLDSICARLSITVISIHIGLITILINFSRLIIIVDNDCPIFINGTGHSIFTKSS